MDQGQRAIVVGIGRAGHAEGRRTLSFSVPGPARCRRSRPALADAWQNRRVIPWLGPRTPFPPLEAALDEPNGLLAASPDLDAAAPCSTPIVMESFPGTAKASRSCGGVPTRGWCCSSTSFAFARSLRKVVRQQRFEIRVDTAFRAVMEACANAPRPGRRARGSRRRSSTRTASCIARGHAHSVEAWREGRLVGGLYGVSIGPDVLRRVDVRAASRTRRRSRWSIWSDCCARTGRSDDRLPAGDRASRVVRRAADRRGAFAERVAALVHSAAPEDAWAPLPASDVLA